MYVIAAGISSNACYQTDVNAALHLYQVAAIGEASKPVSPLSARMSACLGLSSILHHNASNLARARLAFLQPDRPQDFSHLSSSLHAHSSAYPYRSAVIRK